MDHLPYPVNPALTLIEIPYLCEEAVEYDGSGFSSFPLRQQWMTTARESHWCECDADMAALRAQSWLYFGLLFEFFKADFFSPNFIRHDPVTGKSFITTNLLGSMLQKRFSNQAQRDMYSKASSHTILLDAEYYSDQLDRLVPSARIISLSIKVLVCSLGTAAGLLNPENPGAKTIKLSPSRYLKDRMLESGWCPYWIKANISKYSVSVFHYLSALTRNSIIEDHQACTAEKCIAYNVDMHQYKVKHIADDCGCQSMGPDAEEITKLVQSGKIPLICCIETPGGGLRIEVVQGDIGVEYTAISHVWSGGLGNPYSNTLPECQLRRLTKRMQKIAQVESEWYWFRLTERALSNSMICFKNSIKAFLISYGAKTTSPSKAVFWLDTLCVPVKVNDADLKRKAINQMAFIYAGADRVLILDPELQEISSSNIPNEQICAHITCCAWRSRCWTYQEGCLARDRQYLLKDDLYHHSVGLRQLAARNRDIKKGSAARDDTALLHSTVAAFWEEMEKVVDAKHQLDASNVFVTTWNSLGLRSTTKPEDLHGILAVLLGLSSQEILSLKLEERTKAIFRSQASLPLSLLYFPCTRPLVEGPKSKWVSLYPSGSLTLRYGNMKQGESGDNLSFLPADTQSRGFLVDPAFPHNRHFRLTSMSTPVLWQHTVCYILHNPLSNAPESVGARFYVTEFGENKQIHLVYDCPLKYTNRRPLEVSENLVELDDYPEVQGQQINPRTNLVIDSDFTTWYKPRYRRSRIQRLGIWRNIYTAPALIYIWLVWGICLVIWSLGIFGPGPGHRTFIPALIAVAMRAGINYFFDMPLLDETYRRLQYKQWSASLNMHSAPGHFKPDYGSLYQYRPQWTMVLIVLTGCVFLLVGIVLPSYSCRILGGILLVETIPRVTVELVWRRTRVGDLGTRFANRWLHRIKWEGDSLRT